MALPGHQPSRVEDDARAPLHVCASCGSNQVHPLRWEAAEGERWTVRLRCPNCEWTGFGTFDREVLDALDEQLDEGFETLLGDLRKLAAANMAEAVDRFIGAVQAGAVLPEDF